MAGGNALYNGTFQAIVVAAPSDGRPGLYVRVPRLNQDGSMGPCECVQPWVRDPTSGQLVLGGIPKYAVGTRVTVATIAGDKDSVFVVGAVATPAS